jgi:DNA-3-methyladenine glycosylase II
LEVVVGMSASRRAILAASHISRAIPPLQPIIAKTGVIPVPPPTAADLGDAVSAIVVGQMLSRKAADHIMTRVRAEIARKSLSHAWQLSALTLRRCGLSKRKIRTLGEFGYAHDKDPLLEQRWRALDYPNLQISVAQIWGLGGWSAAMLAIFHFGLEDVFPDSDGSIARAVSLLSMPTNLADPSEGTFDAELAAPFRTYLSLYLWAALDRGILAP